MSDFDFGRFVEQVKDATDLVDIISEDGYSFEKGRRGRYTYCKKPDSLMVDEDWGQYTWFAKAGEGGHQYETGDVFDWLKRYRNMEFWGALEHLARKANMQMPETKGQRKSNPERAKAFQARADTLKVAHDFFMKQLWNDKKALAYAHGRGWSDTSIRLVTKSEEPGSATAKGAGLGFSGGSEKAADELRVAFELHGIDLKNPEPATVAMVGLHGGVTAWCPEHEIEPQENWIKQDRIYGLVDFPRLIYPHIGRGGRVVYFSGRNLKAGKDAYVGEDGKHSKYNPPKSLMGERLRYFNWLVHRNVEEIFIVEGQADAVTVGQWGWPAVALCGVASDQGLAELLRKVPHKYLALDSDKTGEANKMAIAELLGPMTRLLEWDPAPLSSDDDIPPNSENANLGGEDMENA